MKNKFVIFLITLITCTVPARTHARPAPSQVFAATLLGAILGGASAFAIYTFLEDASGNHNSTNQEAQ